MADIDVLMGIEGTHGDWIGEMEPKQYQEEFGGSHVRHIVENADKRFTGRSHYVKGPATLATNVNKRFGEVLDHLERYAATSHSLRLHLVGYSRGAAIALDIGNALAVPPGGTLDTLKRLLTYGKTTSVVTRIARLRERLAGRITVACLALFDPVDMSDDIDGDPISANIAAAAVTRRSRLWGSRLGWTNVGDEWERPPVSREWHCPINGTHAAMGGMPGTGDIPKPLARDLLKLPRIDWNQVERRYRSNPLEQLVVQAAFSSPGLFVHPKSSCLVGAPAYLSETMFNPKPLAKRPLAKQPLAKLSDAMLVQTYRRMLAAYADDGGAAMGATSMLLDKKLGSFKGIETYFGDFPTAQKTIGEYRTRDKKASARGREKMSEMLGPAYPATS